MKNPGRSQRLPLMHNFIAFSAVLLLIILVAGSTAFIFSMRQIIKTNKGNELSRMLEIERIKLENSVNKEIAIALKMGSSPLIRRYFTNPNNLELEKIAFEEIADYRRVFAGSVFWINDIDKKFYFDNREPYILDDTAPENYWYPMTLNETEKYNFNINYNPDLNVTNIWINVPVFDNKRKPIGIVGTGVNLSEFIDAVYKDYIGKAKLYFFNAAGEITGAKNVELVAAKKKIEEEFGNIDVKIFSEAKKLDPYEVQHFDTPAGQVVVGRIPVLEWYSIAIAPDSMDDYKSAMTKLFLSMLGLIVLIFIIFNIFIARLLRPLKQTMESLEAASRYKSEFLAKVSHEIRTPMNAMLGMTELALRSEIPPVTREHILTIKQSGTNLLSLVNDILDFSKIESGKLEIIPNDYLLSSLANDVISIIRMRVIDSQIKFVVNIDSNIPNALFGDEIRIRQIFLNILSNAVKFTKEGFVSLIVNGKIVDENTVDIIIEVTDSGRGIKQEDIGRLFHDFVQVDLTANKSIEGTGLGLAISYNLVEAMGGNISVHSKYGEGSTFTVTLPQKIRKNEKIAYVENPEEKNVLVYEERNIYANSIVCSIDNLGVSCVLASSESEFYEKIESGKYSFIFVASGLYERVKTAIAQSDINSQIVLLTEFGESVTDKNLRALAIPVQSISIANILNGFSDNYTYGENKEIIIRFIMPDARILVVDDINTNLKVIEGLMTPYKMQMDLCLSGTEAIDAVKANCYDLIFMDHMMPEMDGIETVRHIRALDGEYYKKIPVIALTANAILGIEEMFLNNGFDDFLSKPIDTVKLNSILEKWIPKEKQRKFKENNRKASTVEEKDAAQNISIKGIDVRKGISLAGGIFKDYLQILIAFYNDGLEKIEEIKKSLETNNFSLYAIYTHALKSASANIGAYELSETAKTLEMAGKTEDSAFIQKYNPKFIVDMEELLSNVGKVIEQENKIDKEKLKAELAKLKTALENSDSKTIEEARRGLKEFTRAIKIGNTIRNILQSALTGEYKEAIALIENMQANFPPATHPQNQIKNPDA